MSTHCRDMTCLQTENSLFKFGFATLCLLSTCWVLADILTNPCLAKPGFILILKHIHFVDPDQLVSDEAI